MTWSVFVDESGSFDGEDTSVIVGLSLERDTEARAAQMRTQLERIWGPGLGPRMPIASGSLERGSYMPRGGTERTCRRGT